MSSLHSKGETKETVRDFIFLGSKITVYGDYSHEIKRHLLLGRKAMINLDSKETLLCWQSPYSHNYGFSVVMYGCEHWTIKKYEELMLLSCGVGEDSWESLGLPGDQTSPK